MATQSRYETTMNTRKNIGVLVPSNGHVPSIAPKDRPIGRAAARLFEENIDVIFGDHIESGRMSGFRARGDQWEAVTNIPLHGVHDRYPSQIRWAQYESIRHGMGTLPMGNDFGFTMLCRDKVSSQRALEAEGIRMPPVQSDPVAFQKALSEWGAAFLKPRFGALGIGVRRVEPGDELPTSTEGVVPNRKDPTIIQAAIQPPVGWASRTVRVLIQRQPDGGWFTGIPVLRQSRIDPVANAARGAEVAPAAELLPPTLLDCIDLEVKRICAAMDRIAEAKRMVEAGLDLVIDSQSNVWLIEINSRPRGRMEVLASHDPATYQDDHVNACARPLRVIATWG